MIGIGNALGYLWNCCGVVGIVEMDSDVSPGQATRLDSWEVGRQPRGHLSVININSNLMAFMLHFHHLQNLN